LLAEFHIQQGYVAYGLQSFQFWQYR